MKYDDRQSAKFQNLLKKEKVQFAFHFPRCRVSCQDSRNLVGNRLNEYKGCWFFNVAVLAKTVSPDFRLCTFFWDVSKFQFPGMFCLHPFSGAVFPLSDENVSACSINMQIQQ